MLWMYWTDNLTMFTAGRNIGAIGLKLDSLYREGTLVKPSCKSDVASWYAVVQTSEENLTLVSFK